MARGLMPTMKEQNRYVSFEIISDCKLSYSDVHEALDKSFRTFLGTLYYSRAGPKIIKNKWNQNSQQGVFKVNSRYLDHAKASLMLVKRINNKNVCVKSVKTSGILNKAG